MSDSSGWYYLDANKQSQGPFPTSYLQELNKFGYFNDATLFWTDGQGEWSLLSQLPDLSTALQQPASQLGADKHKSGASVASAPAIKKGKAGDAQLSTFFAEVTALQEEEEAREGPDSPCAGERSFVDDDGTRYEWDSTLRKFVPAAQNGVGYSEQDMVYVPDVEPIPDAREEAEEEAAVAQEQDTTEAPAEAQAETATETRPDVVGDVRTAAVDKAAESAKRAREAEEAKQAWFELKKNTSVYITGLPDDVTEAELAQVFTKCGIIKEDLDAGKPKVKIYRDPKSGLPKGDGLVTYLKEPSVGLAIQLLDGTPFRYGLPMNMSVSEAKFEQKGSVYVNKGSKKAKKKKLEAQEKALGWRGFDDTLKPTQITVILKNCFSPSELLATPSLRTELEEDVSVEAKKLGTVKVLKVFDTNPEGVVSIKFGTEEAADACVAKMDGRWFGGRQLQASKWDGVTNYHVKVVETEEEQQARLEAYARELEGGN